MLATVPVSRTAVSGRSVSCGTFLKKAVRFKHRCVICHVLLIAPCVFLNDRSVCALAIVVMITGREQHYARYYALAVSLPCRIHRKT
jgi:hypothetical protein